MGINSHEYKCADRACAKVTDFGSSRIVSNANDTSAVGTVRYMTLEVIERKGTNAEACDHRKVDVYSFGMIVWEMFSLKVPFDSLTFTSQIAAALQSNELPQFAPEWDVPPPIQDVVKECPVWSLIGDLILMKSWKN